ncbi:helix-turn-helix domain-containing protein, partial [Rhodococcus sp. NPDC059969]|uniref:helix-turn-helix domain-containing protein n=1 Tax=Rhodococcus sp. NPDC059969 TaxID=3347018 RepID=UPI00366BDB92
MKFDFGLSRDGSVPATWKALYAALASFADQNDRETPDGPEGDEDVPTRARLAECIGMSVDTVDRATKGLEGLGLLEVERRKDPDNPKRNIPSVYRLLDHEIWDERAAARAAKRKAERQAKAEARAARQADSSEGGGRT